MSQIRLAAEAVHSLKVARGVMEAAHPQVNAAQVAETAINALVKYIPTEVVTLYIACVSALPAVKSDFSEVTAVRMYWVFVALTPVFFILVYYNQLAVANQPFPKLSQWPWWRIVASTIAFSVWALAVPNDFFSTNTAGVLSGIGAAFVSTMLSLIGVRRCGEFWKAFRKTKVVKSIKACCPDE